MYNQSTCRRFSNMRKKLSYHKSFDNLLASAIFTVNLSLRWKTNRSWKVELYGDEILGRFNEGCDICSSGSFTDLMHSDDLYFRTYHDRASKNCHHYQLCFQCSNEMVDSIDNYIFNSIVWKSEPMLQLPDELILYVRSLFIKCYVQNIIIK